MLRVTFLLTTVLTASTTICSAAFNEQQRAMIDRITGSKGTYTVAEDVHRVAVNDGIVCDVPGCELGHHGEDVSFDSILKKCQLGRR